MKKNVSGIIWGICIAVLGIILLLKILDVFTLNVFFAGWWSLFIIVPSLIGFIFDKDKLSSVFFIVLGILLLLAANNIIEYDDILKIMLCIAIILIGIRVLLVNIFPNKKNTAIVLPNDSTGYPNYAGIFGGASEKINKSKFTGCHMEAIFGSVELDLRDAKIDTDVYIDSVNIFGGTDIRVPDNVNVVASGVNIFGGTDSQKKQEGKEDNPTIYIKTVCIFGGVDVK